MPPIPTVYSPQAHHADLIFYASVVLGLAGWLALRGPMGMGMQMVALAVVGGLAWSFVEYALHRFVLHGLPPFKAWHQEQHQHPTRPLRAPVALSASLIGLLVWLPSAAALDLWRGSALTLGVLLGYLGYAITDHAVHHGRFRSPWLAQCKYRHAHHHHRYHQQQQQQQQHQQPKSCCYGVTSGLWDRLLGTGGKKRPAPAPIRVVRYNG